MVSTNSRANFPGGFERPAVQGLSERLKLRDTRFQNQKPSTGTSQKKEEGRILSQRLDSIALYLDHSSIIE